MGTKLPRHANVAGFIGACIHKDFPWVVFEFVDGPNLLEVWLREGGQGGQGRRQEWW